MRNYETLKKSKTWWVTIIFAKHVKKGNFTRILYRTAKTLLWTGHDKDLVQLSAPQTMEQEGESF